MKMKTKTILCLVTLAAVALLATGSCKKKDEAQAAASPSLVATAADTGAAAPACDETAWYVCPMAECNYAQKGPGQCPKCGMNLTQAPAAWAPPAGTETGACTAPTCGCPMVAGAQAAALAAKTARELAPEKVGQQATCPVTGETFTVTDATPAVAYEGKNYLFCCMACVPKFVEDPAKYVAAAAPAPSTPPAAAAPAVQTGSGAAPAAAGGVVGAEAPYCCGLARNFGGQPATCPVSGETFTVAETTPAVRYEGQVYLFCCAGCPPKFLANPQQYGASAPTTPPAAAGAAPLPVKTAGELAPDRVGRQETCPVGGDSFTVTADSPAVAYDGKVTIFGCAGCANAFAANPANPAQPNCPGHGGSH
jgi:YHS domain-containing protein